MWEKKFREIEWFYKKMSQYDTRDLNINYSAYMEVFNNSTVHHNIFRISFGDMDFAFAEPNNIFVIMDFIVGKKGQIDLTILPNGDQNLKSSVYEGLAIMFRGNKAYGGKWLFSLNK